jgi:hypothetical protein
MLTFSTWNLDATKILTRCELAAVLADLKRKASRSPNARLNLVICGTLGRSTTWPRGRPNG